jgi:hypothetical protein
MRQAMKLVMIAGMIVTLPAFRAAQNTAASWPGTWPPPAGMNCPRNNAVPFSGPGGVGPYLTNLHASPACVPQPACFRQRAPQDKIVAPGVWYGQSNHVFTIAEQDTIIINARNAAIAQTPAGKQFYRLTFAPDFIVGQSSAVAVTATASYGQCITIVKVDKGPVDPR